MSLENLTIVQRELLEQVQKYKDKHPEASDHSALVAIGRKTSASTLSKAKKVMRTKARKAYTRKPKMITIIPEPHKTSHVVAFVGDADSVVQSVRSLLS